MCKLLLNHNLLNESCRLVISIVYHLFSVNFFKSVGEVTSVRFAMRDEQFRGFGHVEFATAEQAQKVCDVLISYKVPGSHSLFFLLSCPIHAWREWNSVSLSRFFNCPTYFVHKQVASTWTFL